MASIVSRSNGTYLVRVSCGVDSNGKQIARSKTFKPSKPNLPYTKLNRELEGGMAVSIGRLREDSQYDYKFVCLSHNTLRGAAGGAVLLAELLCAQGYMD